MKWRMHISLFDRESAAGEKFLRSFLSGSNPDYRLPGNAVLFSILAIDIAVLGLASYTVLKEFNRIMSWRNNYAVAPPPKTVSIGRAPVKRKSLLLDDFKSAAENRFGGNTGDLNSYGGAMDYEIMSLPEAGERFLKLSYDVSPPSSYCGYISALNKLDLSSYKSLSFKVKGESREEVFKIELGDGETISKVSISQVLPGGLSPDWQTVSIPLKSFSSIRRWNRMDGNLAVLFEHSQGMPYCGTVYIKNVRFIK